jgi:Predicted nucleic acid-binding protein, contains PIN domain
MTSFFVDTSYLIALENSVDQYHRTASRHWSELAKSSSHSFVTSSYVFVEVVTLLNNRRLHSKAVELGKNLLTSRLFNLVHVDEELFDEAWALFQKHKDKKYSLTDCVSFQLMKRLAITEALTFDKHFVQAGFVKLP